MYVQIIEMPRLPKTKYGQGESISAKYSLETVIINEDTPIDDEFWKVSGL